nr:bifunctional DNA-formamidopyrimidine glycosylase/DNA-(apurinic or apyrimidinic site) lyase [Pseudohoeflea sp. DP4N28-3]
MPEVETVRRGLAPVLEGAQINAVEQRRPDLRFPFPTDFASRLTGRRVLRLGRRAKYLLFTLDDDTVLISHLGMSGSFRILLDSEDDEAGGTMPGAFAQPRGKSSLHDHLVLRIEGPLGPATITYNDPRRFGFMELTCVDGLDAHPRFASLGVEPTGNELSAPYLAQRLAGKSSPLKTALMDQSIIAGLGNIYVCEALWRAGLSPTAPAKRLVRKAGRPTARLETLTATIRAVIHEAIAAGGSSLRDHIRTDGSLGYFQHRFSVYGREGEPCAGAGCNNTVRRISQAGRSTFYCPRCQKH